MKRSKQCPKCDSRRVGHLAEQVDVDDRIKGPTATSGASEPPHGRVVGYSHEKVDTGFWAYGTLRPLLGKLEAYVCTDCGYHESYVVEPQRLDWAKLVGFSWLNPETKTDGPFR